MQIVIMDGKEVVQEDVRLGGLSSRTAGGNTILEFNSNSRCVRLVVDQDEAIEIIAKLANAVRR